MPSSAEVDSMVVKLTGDGSSYMGMLDRARQATISTTARIGGMVDSVGSYSVSLKTFAAQAVAALVPLVGIGFSLTSAFKGVELAASAEKMEVEFGVLLKSAEKGKELVKALQEFAAETPLNLGDIQKASKTLLQFGVTGNNLIPMMRKIGDVALGDPEKLQRIALAYGQAKGKGRLQGEEKNQMIEAGFNPLMEMERTTGKSMTQLDKMMEAGQISVKMLEDAFTSATSKGGNWFQGMEKQSQTLFGLFSTMKDDIDAVLRGIGKSVIEAFDLKAVVKQVSSVSQRVTSFLSSASPKIYQTAAAIFVSTVAVGLLVGGFIALGAAIMFVWGSLGPISIVLLALSAVAVAFLSAFIINAGGIGAALEKVGKWLQHLWETLLPVRQAFVSLWTFVTKTAVEWFDDAVMIFNYLLGEIAGSTTTTWADVVTVIQTAVLVIEFVLRNLSTVAEFVFTYMVYQATVAVNQIEYFFTEVIPAAFGWLVSNGLTLFTDYYRALFVMSKNYVMNYVALISSVPGLIQGSLSLDDVFKKMKAPLEGFKRGVYTDLVIPDRVVGQNEKNLLETVERQGAAIGGAWQKFQQDKLNEFANEEWGGGDDWEDKGADDGKKYNQALGKELHKVDSVLFDSAEAFSRVNEYFDKKREGTSGLTAGSASAKADPNVAVQTNTLKSIDATMKYIAKTPSGAMPANLLGGS